MAIETQTITDFGTGDTFAYAGGSGTVAITGVINGVAKLMISLDDTNFSEGGSFTTGGAHTISNIPACTMRWDVDDVGLNEDPDFVASVENA
jgi:hypothetical protein